MRTAQELDDPHWHRRWEALAALESAADARGRPFTVHKLPLPGPLYMSEAEAAAQRGDWPAARQALARAEPALEDRPRPLDQLGGRGHVRGQVQESSMVGHPLLPLRRRAQVQAGRDVLAYAVRFPLLLFSFDSIVRRYA